ncbi:MAG: 50S ribosomal protein L6 [Planctomycetota bacterium]|nr:50S ribosomal protein L6 [Planctomycetota bacterium]
MSRIGKKPVEVPAGVKVNVAQRKVSIEGPGGKLEHTFPYGVGISLEGNTITVTRTSDSKQHRAFHGMTRALLANMVTGVKTPFEKILEIHGTGYNADVKGQELELDIGFSNKVKIKIPRGLEVKIDKQRPVVVRVLGADKQAVGQLSAEIRKIRPPSPYGENKGIRYRGEVIRKKAGKAFGEKK